MKYFSLALVIVLLPALTHAATPVYSHFAQADVKAVDSSEGLGEPDGVPAQIVEAGSTIIYGFPEVTTARLHKAHIYDDPSSVLSERPWIKIELLLVGDVVSTSFQRIDGTLTDNKIGPSNPDPYDRVRFTLLSGAPFLLDAVWHLDDGVAVDPEPDSELVPEPDPAPSQEPETTSSTDTGSQDTSSEESSSEAALTDARPRLIKLFNDGDPVTQHDTTVYVVDSEGKRRPFSHEVIYFSWFTDFSAVEEISLEEMAAIPVGAPMPMHYGTWLVKIQSTNDVYAVSRPNRLHLIPDEATAIALYGDDWATRVRDVSPTDWPHYAVWDDVFLTHPDDTLIRDGNLITWIFRGGMRYQVPELELDYHGIQRKHRVDRPFTDFFVIPIGDLITRDDDAGWFDI